MWIGGVVHLFTHNHTMITWLSMTFLAAAAVVTCSGSSEGAATTSNITVNQRMALPEIKAFTIPCSTHWQRCDEDKDCAECFDPFTPAFSMQSFEGCDEFEQSFFSSCSKKCDLSNDKITKLEKCVADTVFEIMTLGAVNSFCSIYGTELVDKYDEQTKQPK